MGHFKFASLAAVLTLLALFSGPSHAESTLQTVKARGTMIAGVRFDSPPYGSIDESGKNVGIDIDIAGEIAKRLGVKLELARVTGQSRIPTLESGKVDLLIADLTHTAEREKAIDFTMTYVDDGVAVLVRKASNIRTPADLNGKSISFVQGSTGDAALKNAAPQAKPTLYQEYPQAFLAFQQGLTDAFISDAFIMGQFLKTNPDQYEIVHPYLADEPIAIGVRKDDPGWKNTLNGLLRDMVKDGTWARIIKKYVSIPVQTPNIAP